MYLHGRHLASNLSATHRHSIPKVQTPPSAEAVFALGADSGLRISDLLTQTMCFKSLQIWYLELIEPVEEVVLEMPKNLHNYQITT